MSLSRLDAATLALYLSGVYDVHARLRVANGSGTLVDLQGRWIGFTRDLPNPDAPIGALNVDLVRETDYGGSDSLAPQVQASTWNRLDGGVTYSPLLVIGRLVTLDVALTVEKGARPADASALWYEAFRGHITEPSGPRHDGHVMSIRCNEYTGFLRLAKSEQAYVYAAGTPIETAIRACLDNNGFASYALDVPVATGKVLEADYAPGRQKPVWDQVWGLAQSIAWVIWPRYRSDNTPALTLFLPPRDKSVSDLTVGKLRDFPEFRMVEDQIRNVLYVPYVDADGVRQEVGPLVDSDSVQRYGDVRRPTWIVFDEKSPVRTREAALAVGNAALSDVADPDVLATAHLPAMPFVECASDLYTFPANPRFFDTPQQYAPFAGSWSVRADTAHSGQYPVRGKPSAGFRTWRRFMSASNVEDDPALQELYDAFLSDPYPDGSALLTFQRGAAVGFVRGAAAAFPLPRDDAHKASLVALLQDARYHLSVDELLLPAPPSLHYTLAVVQAFDANAVGGEVIVALLNERFTTPEELAVVEQMAADAVLAAAGAQAAADGKITTFWQDDAPTAEGLGDLWMDTNDKNHLYRWDGDSWEPVRDQAIIDAIEAAADAQETADGKIVSFYQTATPTAEGVGDLWTDTDDGNHLHRWNGAAWVSIRDGTIAIAQTTAESALSAAEAAAELAGDAQAVADGKIDSFFQTEPPTGSVGDFWIDSNDGNRLYRHNGVGWEESDDERIVQALTNAAGAQATADGKVTTFFGTGAPTATAVGDLWFDTDDGNHQYRWSGSAWVSAHAILLGVRVASVSPDGEGGDVAVTVNVEANVATGLGGVEYAVDAGSWTQAVVGVGRSATFDVPQTLVQQALKVRGLRVVGDASTAGQEEAATIPAYVAPVIPVVLSGVSCVVTDNTTTGNDEYYSVVVGSGFTGKSLEVKYYRNGSEVHTAYPTISSDVTVNAYWLDTGGGDGIVDSHYVTATLYDTNYDYGTKSSRTVNSAVIL